MPLDGMRRSDNIVIVGPDGLTEEQRDQLIQDVLIAGALRDYFDWRGEDIDLSKEPFCYSVNDEGEATVIECPIEAP